MISKTDLIRRTAEFFKLNPTRWVRHSLSTSSGCYCTVGYMDKVLRDSGERVSGTDAYRRVTNFLGVDADRLVQFNDSTATGPEDVVEFLVDEIKQEVNA